VPDVSVVMPAHDAERYLAEAISSVLAQTRRDLELLVVDDGSTDRTKAIAEGFGEPVRCLSRERGGIGAARNLGVERASGRHLAFLDADDLWVEDKLERQLGAVSGDVDLVLGLVREFVSPELGAERAARIRCAPEPRPGYLPGALLVAREAFERVGPFREDLRVGEFVDWMARARELGLKELMLPREVLRRRLHDENQSVRNRDDMSDFARVVKASLDRRRGSVA
jgi:glycosyltransferase involved in cell wall biosynthesis